MAAPAAPPGSSRTRRTKNSDGPSSSDSIGDETTPLLPNSAGTSAQAIGGIGLPKKSRWCLPRFTNPLDVGVIHPRYKKVPYLAALIIFFNEFDFFLKHVPMRRIVEDLHCIEYYEAHDRNIILKYGHKIPERLCKGTTIQVQTSRTLGIIGVVLMACAFTGALPLGRLADRWGRKWPLFMNKLTWVFFTANHLFVYLMYPRVPIQLLYISGIFAIQGGNFDTGIAILYTSISDVIPRAEDRTSVFFVISAMLPLAQITPPLGGVLLDLDGQGGTPWIPFLIALVSISISAILCATVYPETIQREKKPSSGTRSNGDSQTDNGAKPHTIDDSETSSLLGQGHENNHSNLKQRERPIGTKPGLTVRTEDFFLRTWRAISETLDGLGLPSMILLTFAMFLVVVSRVTVDWQALQQYATIKLEWPLAKTTMTLTIQAIINLLTLSLLLPYLTRLGATHLSASTTSLLLILLCTPLLITGMLLIGISTSPPLFITGIAIYTLGLAFPIALQAYIGTRIAAPNMARVMTVLSLAQTGAKVVSSLVFPTLLEWGLESRMDVMVGLPFFVAAACFAAAGFAVGGHVLLLRAGRGKGSASRGRERV
ncbi:MAG: hypothetical protein M1814_001931 [Vezdaea aestivalis]|nr:MAG: hypothetical protein M1814_001931 [Vezdaea aestivalis]